MFPPFLCGLLQCSCYCAIASLSCVSGTLFNHQPCKEFIISWTAGNIRHSLMSGLIRLNLYREISYYLLKKKKHWQKDMERHGNIAVLYTHRQRNRKNLHCTTFLRAVQWKDSNKKASEIHFCLAKMNSRQHYQINYQDILSICFTSIAPEEEGSLRKEKQYELRSEVQEYPWAQH